MTDTKALDALIEAVEAGEEYLEREIQDAFGGYKRSHISQSVVKAYNGSIDAAKALHEALLPGWVTWDASRTYFGYEWYLTNGDDTVYACCKESPARAWLIAVLKAYRACL